MSLDSIEPRPWNADPMREYILDMLDQLAAMAAEHGDPNSARALWACWSQVSQSQIQPQARTA